MKHIFSSEELLKSGSIKGRPGELIASLLGSSHERKGHLIKKYIDDFNRTYRTDKDKLKFGRDVFIIEINRTDGYEFTMDGWIKFGSYVKSLNGSTYSTDIVSDTSKNVNLIQDLIGMQGFQEILQERYNIKTTYSQMMTVWKTLKRVDITCFQMARTGGSDQLKLSRVDSAMVELIQKRLEVLKIRDNPINK